MRELLPNRDIDLREQGGLIFYEEAHQYFNAEGIQYTGMTTFLKDFGEKFDAEKTARYKAIKDSFTWIQMKNLKNRIEAELSEPRKTAWTKVHLYYHKVLAGRDPDLARRVRSRKEELLEEWEQSTVDGSLEHDRREKDVIENGYTWKGKHYPYSNKSILEVTQDDVCVIPEIMVWDHDLQMCGLVDLPIFDKGVIHILDYKTNKKIESEGFMNRMMTGAFSEHPDCNKSKYSAQLYGYQKMACDLTGFKVGECWLISTASQKYYRQEDEFIECTDMTTEIINAFTKKK